MRMNPYNSVLGLGHSNGTVTMWSPNMSTPLVSMLCHRGPVTTVAYDFKGLHMVTGGMDGQVKVWDVRKFVPLHTYYSTTTPKSLDISQKGLIAVGCGSKIEIWRDALSTKQVRLIQQSTDFHEYKLHFENHITEVQRRTLTWKCSNSQQWSLPFLWDLKQVI